MSNATRQFHRRWAREAGIPWSDYGRRPRVRNRKPEHPVKFDVVHDDREEKRKARKGWMGAAGRALASVFGFARRRT